MSGEIVMTAVSRLVFAVGWSLLAVTVCCGAEKPPRLDASGDALPEYALARLGSLRFRDPYGFTAVALSPDGKVFALQDGKQIRLLDAVSGKPLRTIEEPDLSLGHSQFSPDGKLLATVRTD